jgi:hypothetical protein
MPSKFSYGISDGVGSCISNSYQLTLEGLRPPIATLPRAHEPLIPIKKHFVNLYMQLYIFSLLEWP